MLKINELNKTYSSGVKAVNNVSLDIPPGLIISVGLIAIVVQIAKSNGPFELSAYARVYPLILAPNAIFVTAAALMPDVYDLLLIR